MKCVCRVASDVWLILWPGPAGVWAVSDWYMDCVRCLKCGPAPARCAQRPTRHRPGIDRFIGDQNAMRNAAQGFKSKLKVTWCPPDSQNWPGSRKGVPWGPGRKCLEISRKLIANPSQANCDWAVSDAYIPIKVRQNIFQSELVHSSGQTNNQECSFGEDK